MKLTFLGGADEVGASCTLVELAGKRLLVDCGIRMSPRDGDTLPWLAPIEEAGGIDAIILTHAHMDHSGALPVIHPSYAHVPIYMTAATLSLTTILLLDSLKIMQSEQEQSGEVPLYPQPAVELTLGAAKPVSFGQTRPIFDGEIQLTYYPAGHILGAAMVLIESDEGSILMGGDISVTEQKTIPGMMLPSTQPDVVVIESTYGGRLHANRAAEEIRLLDQVREVLERKGSVLFPAFAVGRAQEVILIIKQAIEQGRLPKVPIFVDGMVRQICQVYSSYPDLMAPWLRKRIQKMGNPFFHEGSPVEGVWDYKKRASYAQMRPSVIVSSSGMLTGGPSPFYARYLAKDPASWIAITGYQDEESPGRRLQEVAKAGGGSLKLGDQEVTLSCGVGTYGLSAHADESQIVSALTALAPTHVALVHGDGGARESLQAALERVGQTTVHLPKIGTVLEVEGTRRASSRSHTQANAGITTPATPLAFEDLEALAHQLFARDHSGRLYTVQELLLAWGDQEGAHNEHEVQRVTRLLQREGAPFRRDRKRPFLYRALGPSNEARKLPSPDAKKHKVTQSGGKLDPFNALQVVDRHLPESTGLYKRSTLPDQETIQLSFHFPKVAADKYADALQNIERESGWKVKVRPGPHQGVLSQRASAILPEGWDLSKEPSLRLNEESVMLQLTALPSVEEASAVAQSFFEETGFVLTFKGLDLPRPTQAGGETSESDKGTPEADAPLASEEAFGPDQVDAFVEAMLAKPAPTPAGEPLEINQSYQLIKEAFRNAPHELLKVSQKQGKIEVAFLSEQVGQWYQPYLARLEEETGHSIQIRPRADQHRIKELAKKLLPEDWGLRKEPGFHQDKAQVSAKIATPPPLATLAAIQKEFKGLTGFSLTVEVK